MGAESVADQMATVSVGNDYLKRRIVNVANGRNTNDAATVGQLRGALSTLGGNIDANGNVTTPASTSRVSTRAPSTTHSPPWTPP